MGVVMMFMILASVAPYLFYQLNKKWLASLQAILVVGMWFYAINISLVGVTPGVFSITWSSFYLSLILAEVAWVMFIIHVVKTTEKTTLSYE
ncbi:hypothetical protein [Piscibacillus halophilus]|uniref:Uncharacterized protein n=1 Tax=Piscibacillus halophilus TaxID=571933 RepID=A0A1H9DTP4_9BACI|nr:hypothetical protein [Piscibacillus halophilus]SEQ16193.1 hypothetical protein SAMN05216362_10797 [Piscibacillus halophilus]